MPPRPGTHKAISAGLVEACETEIGDYGAQPAIGAGENNIAALEIAMDDALAMGLGESGADLARDFAGLLFGYRPIAVNAFGEGLPLDELHGKEVELPQVRDGGMQVIHFADVEVADLTGGAGFGRKPVAVSELGAFQRDAAVELFVDGLEHDTHAAETDFADDPEAVIEETAGGERVGKGRPLDERIEEEAAHPLFPLDAAADLFVNGGVPAECAQPFIAFRLGRLESFLHERHDQLVVLLTGEHRDSPTARRASGGHRRTGAAWCAMEFPRSRRFLRR